MKALLSVPSLSLAALLALVGACGGTNGSTAAANATEAAALAQELGVTPSEVAANQDGNGKITICHYPPGNRANMQTLSVGAPAVPPHIRNHGDKLGACEAADSGHPIGGTDAGAPNPRLDAGTANGGTTPGGSGKPDAGPGGPTCVAPYATCTSSGSSCCSGTTCQDSYLGTACTTNNSSGSCSCR